MSKLSQHVELIHNHIMTLHVQTPFHLIHNLDVLRWVWGDLSYLPAYTRECENEWGLKYAELVCSTSNMKRKQWTHKFGELIGEDLMRLHGEYLTRRQVHVDNLRVDFETTNYVIEVKTGTYRTSGTAHEKILGTPLKYAHVPKKTHKKLYILCIAGAERYMRKFHFMDEQRVLVNVYKALNIEFKYATDILMSVLIN